jgi:RimJ/RimL family protein N-acetyltransferase
MTPSGIETQNLRLVLHTPEDVRNQIERMKPEEKAEVSKVWLARFAAAKSADPWVHGFRLVHRVSGSAIGQCGFKGPPGIDGAVEIAYGIAPEYQGKGYATEAAQALAKYALSQAQVLVVRAHTRPAADASARVLTKCGFRRVGEVIDPEDGLVWRWEKHHEKPAEDRL